MAQSSHEITAKIMQRMELTVRQKNRRRNRIVSGMSVFAFALITAAVFLIPRGMEADPPVAAEASVLGGVPLAGLLMLCCVIAVTVVISAILLLRKKRLDTLNRISDRMAISWKKIFSEKTLWIK